MSFYVIKHNDLYWSKANREWLKHRNDATWFYSREECYRDLGFIQDKSNRSNKDAYAVYKDGSSLPRIVKVVKKAKPVDPVKPGTVYYWTAYPERIYLVIPNESHQNEDDVTFMASDGDQSILGNWSDFWEEVSGGGIKIIHCPLRNKL